MAEHEFQYKHWPAPLQQRWREWEECLDDPENRKKCFPLEKFFHAYLEFIEEIKSRVGWYVDSDESMPSDCPQSNDELINLEDQDQTNSCSTLPQIPGYTILELIGRGGMGVVYKARHEKLNRLVALKMIAAGANATEDQLERFNTEARAVAQIQHPNIVQIHEIGTHDDLPYFSLEFVEGGSLAQQTNGIPQPPDKAAELVMILAKAMAVAHRLDIVHRDLKPANVLLDKEGQPKITDFGLAKLVEEDTGATQEGTILGSPGYMPPEQASGDLKAVDHLSDIYSLGAVLYEMLTGKPPFQGTSTPEILEQVRQKEPTPLTQLQPTVPVDVETICLKCLQKDKRKRYESAQALADDLGRFFNREPIYARPISSMERLWRWCKRHPQKAIAAISILIAAAFGGFAVYYNIRASHDRDSMLQATRNADLQRAKTEMATKAASAAKKEELSERHRKELSLYFKNILRAKTEWEENHTNQAEAILDGCKPEFRQFEWYYLKYLCRSDLLTLVGTQEPFSIVAFHPENDLIAISGHAGIIRIYDGTSGKEKASLCHGSRVSSIAFRSDGQYLASGGKDGIVCVWDLASGKKVGSFHSHSHPILAIAFLPKEGKQILSVDASEMKAWDVHSGKESFSLKGQFSDPLRVSPDGKWVATLANNRRDVFILDADTWKIRQSWRHRNEVADMEFGKNETNLIIATNAGKAARAEISIWDIGKGKRLSTIAQRDLGFLAIDVSLKGTKIVAGEPDSLLSVWDTADQSHLIWRGHRSPVTHVAINADGTRMYSRERKGIIKVWGASSEQGSHISPGSLNRAWCVAVHPSGKFIAWAGDSQTIHLWNPLSGKSRQIEKAHQDVISDLDFSPNGKVLVSVGKDQTIRVWDTQLYQSIQNPQRSTKKITGVALSPNGEWITSWGRGEHVTIRHFLRNGTHSPIVISLPKGKAVQDVAFTPTGNIVAIAYGNEIILWDFKEMTTSKTLRGHEKLVRSIDINAEGTLLFSTSTDHTVRMWDLKSGNERWKKDGHKDAYPECVAFDPEGRRGASGDRKGYVRIWDIETGQETLSFQAHKGRVRDLQFSPKSDFLVTVGEDGKARVWPSPRVQPKP